MDALTDKEATGKVEQTEEIKQRVQADEEEDEEDQIKSQAHLGPRQEEDVQTLSAWVGV